MTKLTLHWHLKTIVKGVPEVKSKPIERDEFGVIEWEYTDDFYSTGSGEYSKENGCVNDSYDSHLASEALNSDDSVAYLDAVSRDPCVDYQLRIEAAELLSHHIMERRLISQEERRSVFEEDREMRKRFINAMSTGELPKRSMKSSYWKHVHCPKCNEYECLFDIDRTSEPNHCLNCGSKIPIPEYP